LQIQYDNAKFCPECGNNFLIENKNEPNDYSKGIKLETFVMNILKEQEFDDIKTRQKLSGRSQSLHEIDILAKKNNRNIAIECKNYAETRIVGIKEIRDFWSKLQDVSDIYYGIFVTTSKFSSESILFAKHHNIILWDGEKLSRIHYLISIGRFNSINKETFNDSLINKKESNDLNVKKIYVLERAFPLKVTYEDISKINVDNPLFLDIALSKLTFEPFYKIRYTIIKKKKSYSFRNSNTIEGFGYITLNANTGHIVGEKFIPKEDNSKTNKILSAISDNLRIKTGLANSNQSKSATSENSIYNNIINENLISMLSEERYVVKKTDQFDIILNNIHSEINKIEEILYNRINNLLDSQYDELEFEEKELIYIPKWYIIFHGNNKFYYRVAWAHKANLYITDDIRTCPNDSKTDDSISKTFIVCEICGGCYCNNHSFSIENHSYCNYHSSSQIEEHQNKQLSDKLNNNTIKYDSFEGQPPPFVFQDKEVIENDIKKEIEIESKDKLNNNVSIFYQGNSEQKNDDDDKLKKNRGPLNFLDN
jgi:hypothetical protein